VRPCRARRPRQIRDACSSRSRRRPSAVHWICANSCRSPPPVTRWIWTPCSPSLPTASRWWRTLTQANGTVCERRHAKLPAEINGADILSDLQLALWPADVIRASLPAGLVLTDDGTRRVLASNGREAEIITYSGTPRWAGLITLRNLEYDYSLVINSVVSSP
jgi:hypothetical protein